MRLTDRCLWRTLCLTLLLLSGESLAQSVLINCGGGGYTDSYGRNWRADVAYSPGVGYGAIGGMPDPGWGLPLGGTRDPVLLQSARYGVSEYRFDVPNGPYTLLLRLSERQMNGPGLRAESILAEGTPLLSGVDIAALVGKDYALEWGSASTSPMAS